MGVGGEEEATDEGVVEERGGGGGEAGGGRVEVDEELDVVRKPGRGERARSSTSLQSEVARQRWPPAMRPARARRRAAAVVQDRRWRRRKSGGGAPGAAMATTHLAGRGRERPPIIMMNY